jgi:hypothetical protein
MMFPGSPLLSLQDVFLVFPQRSFLSTSLPYQGVKVLELCPYNTFGGNNPELL